MSKILSLETLTQKQLKNFSLNNKSLDSPAAAAKFLKCNGIALRYWENDNLPLASLYQAAWGRKDSPPKKIKGEPGKISLREEVLRKGIELSNHLLASHEGIEVSVIAKRLTLVHRDLIPSLYVLVRRHRKHSDLSDVSPQARKVYQLIEDNKETTVGIVRKFLGSAGRDPLKDPAYLTLSELQNRMLIDRGPFIMRDKGIPYLSKEGYPYHCFHSAHKELILAAKKLSVENAAQEFLSSYLKGTVFAPYKKLLTLFNGFLTPKELDSALSELSKKKKISIEKINKTNLVVVVTL